MTTTLNNVFASFPKKIDVSFAKQIGYSCIYWCVYNVEGVCHTLGSAKHCTHYV